MVDRRSVVAGFAGTVAASMLPVPLLGFGSQALAQATPVAGGTLNIGLHIPLSTLDWQSVDCH